MMKLPPFTIGTDYRELSGREGRFRWRWELLKDTRIPLPFVCRPFSCHNEDKWEWMRVTNGYQIIRAGYRWNGASPKKFCRILNRWIGTPDTQRNLRGTCSHDAFYQASGLMGYPVARSWADDVFLDVLKLDGFRWANLYHGAVTDFGATSWHQRHPGQYIEML